MPFKFVDRTLVTPATVSHVYDSRIEDRGAPLGTLALIGQAVSVKPQEAVILTAYAEAESIFQDPSEYLVKKAIQKAFNPSPDTGGPAKIIFINANPIDQVPATLNLKDTSATPVAAIKVTADKNGPQGASITLKIENGTAVNGVATKKLTVNKTSSDRIVRRLFSMAYNGAATVVTATVAADKIIVVADTVTKELSFSTYKTVAGLVGALNALKAADNVAALGFTATAIPVNKNSPTTDLDSMAATTVGATATFFTANVVAMVTAINRINGVSAERLPGAFPAVANIGTTALVYTDTLNATASDWFAAIELLKRYDVDWIVPLTASKVVHTMVVEHVGFMSETVNMERRAVVGNRDGITDALVLENTVNYADELRNHRVSLVNMGLWDKNGLGKMTLYPTFVFAALVGGMMCGVAPGTPLTNKRINASGMQQWLLNPTDTDPLVEAGVLVGWKDYQGDIRILQSISTAQAYDEDGSYNFYRNEMSVGAATDYLSKEIRKVADGLRGLKNTPYLPHELKARVEARLAQLSKPEPEGEGVLVGDDANPPFRGVTVTQGVDWMTVEFQASPVTPANYIGIVIHAAPYTGAGTV